MARPGGLELSEEGSTLRAVIPAGRNLWFVVGAVVFGVPWLIGVVIGVFVAFNAIPDSRAGLVWMAVLLGTIALTALLDAVALALIWLAFYTLSGSETLEVSETEISVRRKAVGIPMGAHAKRGHFDRVTRLDTTQAPGRVPHPQIEVSGAYSRVRIGSGLTRDEADLLEARLKEFMAEHGPQQLSGRGEQAGMRHP